MNSKQERWERFFVAALAGATSFQGAARVSEASIIADLALKTADDKRFPRSSIDKLIKACEAIEDFAPSTSASVASDRSVPVRSDIIELMRQALAEMRK